MPPTSPPTTLGPIEVIEKHLSRPYDSKRAILLYIIKGTAYATNARAALIGYAPATFGGLYLYDAHVDPVFVNINDEPNSIWDGEVVYTARQLTPTDDSTYQFEIGGGTEHITNAISTVNSYPPGADDMKGAIGFDGQHVQGLDKGIGTYNWSETKYKTDAEVNQEYKRTLANLAWHMNDAPFGGFGIHEVLFQGVTGQYRAAQNDWELTFKFARSPNKTGLTFGDITGIAKDGWDYLWILYKDDSGGRKFRIPKAVYIDRIYEEGDFTGLGIGTGGSTLLPTTIGP